VLSSSRNSEHTHLPSVRHPVSRAVAWVSMGNGRDPRGPQGARDPCRGRRSRVSSRSANGAVLRQPLWSKSLPPLGVERIRRRGCWLHSEGPSERAAGGHCACSATRPCRAHTSGYAATTTAGTAVVAGSPRRSVTRSGHSLATLVACSHDGEAIL
jgi:hypothetical protein